MGTWDEFQQSCLMAGTSFEVYDFGIRFLMNCQDVAYGQDLNWTDLDDLPPRDLAKVEFLRSIQRSPRIVGGNFGGIP